MMLYLRLFWEFFKTGLFTIGGGMATVPFLYKMSDATGWFTYNDLANMIAVGESTPGPIGVNMATYVGSAVGGQDGGVLMSIFGAFCATMGVVLPSFVIILIVARCYEKFKENKIVKGCMTGLKPAVVGLIGGAVLSVVLTVFFPAGFTLSVVTDPAFYVSLGIFIAMVILAFKKVHPIIIICLSAVIGIVAGYLGV